MSLEKILKECRKKFPNNLRVCREFANYTQEELGAAIGVPAATISRWENGIRWPKVEALIKMVHLLKCDMDELVGYLE